MTKIPSYRAGCTAGVSPTVKAGSGACQAEAKTAGEHVGRLPEACSTAARRARTSAPRDEDLVQRPARQRCRKPARQFVARQFAAHVQSDRQHQRRSAVSEQELRAESSLEEATDHRRRRLSASGCAARLASSQSASLGAAGPATKPNAGNGISSR